MWSFLLFDNTRPFSANNQGIKTKEILIKIKINLFHFFFCVCVCVHYILINNNNSQSELELYCCIQKSFRFICEYALRQALTQHTQKNNLVIARLAALCAWACGYSLRSKLSAAKTSYNKLRLCHMRSLRVDGQQNEIVLKSEYIAN